MEVWVVGAGIAGLSTAYLLARAGAEVVALDDGPVGSGQTRRTTAHLATALDDRWLELERVRGARIARLAADSYAAAVDRIEEIVAAEEIDFSFERVDGHLFLGPGQGASLLEEERARPSAPA